MHWWLVYLKKKLNKTTKEATLDPHFKPQTYEQELKLQEKGIENPTWTTTWKHKGKRIK